MKKRPAPYALIGAVSFGVIAIVAFWAYTQQQISNQQVALEDQRKQLETEFRQQLNDALNRPQPPSINAPNLAAPSRRVLYAKEDIDASTPITADMLQAMDTPDNLIIGAYTVADSNMVEKDFSQRPIRRGEPLTDANVGPNSPRLSDRLVPGMKAMTIPVICGAGNLTGGFLTDGDKIDLLYNHPEDRNDPKSSLQSDLVMQNVSVLFVPGSQQRSSKTESLLPAGASSQCITLEVTIKEAQILTLLQALPNGQFGMMLRGHDATIAKTPAVLADDLLDNPAGIEPSVLKSEKNLSQLKDELKDKPDKTDPTPTVTQ